MRFVPALLAAFLALPLASCQDASTPTAVNPTVKPLAAFDMAQRFTEPVDLIASDPCDGENVHWVGELRYVSRVSPDGAGGYHYVSAREWEATGTGLTSGDTYKINAPYNWTYYFQGPFPEIYTQVWDNFITKNGAAGGYVLRSSQKVVLNGNGDVVQDSPTYDYICLAH